MSFFTTITIIVFFNSILFTDYPIIHSKIKLFNYFVTDKQIFSIVKYIFIIPINNKKEKNIKVPVFGLLIGKDLNNNNIYISENSLYQNILVTGSIGSGKTSSAMYPFTKQLIKYESLNNDKKL
ncbi:hypothetical protein ACQCP7_26405, partial [Ralstonia pseudosolanacearum]|uniref:hypothetical protein n=1 Tax=Ralstonia pseudosolanacearum TaxID=1310165 RepID=UPI003CEBB19D